MINNTEKKLHSTQQYLIAFHTNRLCLKLAGRLFLDLKAQIATDPSLPSKLFDFLSEVIAKAPNIKEFDDEKYNVMVSSALSSFHYPGFDANGSNPTTNDICVYAKSLRALFRANEELLNNEFGLKKFGELPISNSIHEFLAPQFELLSKSFAIKALLKMTSIDNIDLFIRSSISEVKTAIDKNIDPNKYLG